MFFSKSSTLFPISSSEGGDPLVKANFSKFTASKLSGLVRVNFEKMVILHWWVGYVS